VIAVLLLLESAFNALHVAGLLGVIGGYDPVAKLLIIARGLTGALQFAGGWTLVAGRPAGRALARAAVLVAAILTTLDVGFDLAPMDVYPWWRWQIVAIYWVYAIGMVGLLSRTR
jgi:membrane-associated protease RseP (regulator of RpoE activity)